ncbi:MAG: hypothetical protein CMJ78_10260 [Planctomycetaceae bacterium]|nr:hypothetical protein [Planctomycetaceae bacterium]
MRLVFSLVFATVAFTAYSNASYAQPKPLYAPSSTHIFPAGAQRGSAIDVRVGGECLPPNAQFEVIGSGLTAPKLLGSRASFRGEPSPRRKPTEIPRRIPKEWQTRVNIDADAALGPVLWRLSCAQGGTCSRPFIIGELPEFIERESNSIFKHAEKIKLPVTVNGQISGERDLDHFRFEANAGDVVVLDMMAARLGSRLDPIVDVLDGKGKVIRVQQIHAGSDPVIALKAPSTGSYVLRIGNVTFHGDPAHVYRVNITTKPYVHFVFPPGGESGKSAEVDVYTLTGIGKDQVARQELNVADSEEGLQWETRLGGNGIPFQIEAMPTQREVEPNDQQNAATNIALPQVVYGQCQQAGDADWYRVNAKSGQQITVLCEAFPPGADTLPTIDIVDEAGKELTAARSTSSKDGVALIDWKAKKDGQVFIRVRDIRFQIHGNPKSIYRMQALVDQPDFHLATSDESFTVIQEKLLTLPVNVRRTGGFNQPIELSIEGLPEGVTLETKEIPAKGEVSNLKLKATGEVPSKSYSFQIVGRAKVGDTTITRKVCGYHKGRDSEGVGIAKTQTSDLHLTVAHKPVFRLYCAEAYQYAHRGSIFMYPMQVERINGFDQPITLQIGDRQNRDLDGIEMLEVVIPSDSDSRELPIYLPETMHINIQSQSQLYSQAYASFVDDFGQKQSVLVLSEKRNMLRTLPPVVKMMAVKETVAGHAGGEVTCALRLERTTNFPGPMTVSLLESNDHQFRATPIKVAKGQNEFRLFVDVPNSATSKPTTLKFRATGKMEDGTEIITEAAVEFRPLASGR